MRGLTCVFQEENCSNITEEKCRPIVETACQTGRFTVSIIITIIVETKWSKGWNVKTKVQRLISVHLKCTGLYLILILNRECHIWPISPIIYPKMRHVFILRILTPMVLKIVLTPTHDRPASLYEALHYNEVNQQSWSLIIPVESKKCSTAEEEVCSKMVEKQCQTTGKLCSGILSTFINN